MIRHFSKENLLHFFILSPRFFIFIFALCSLLFALPIAHAQVPTSIDGIDITINPTNPIPGKNVEISLQDYLSDISSAYITWVVNGNKVTEGVGKNDITLTAPALGKESDVAILIQTEDGKTVQKSVVIKSGSVDLVWESQGYAPPLYQGKQDFAYENSLKIIAMPHLADSSGVEIDPTTLIYNWKQDSTVLQDQSGYGKQSVTITGSVIPRPTTIYVDVSTRDGSETASGVITLQAGSPSVVFYKDDPLYGVLYNVALGAQTTFSNQEITLLAVPFSFTMPSLTNNNIQYSWTINGAAQTGLTTNRSVTLRVQDTSADANYPVQLQLQNMKEILQGATNAITVMFQANKNNNAISL
jgi:hypothetical protein